MYNLKITNKFRYFSTSMQHCPNIIINNYLKKYNQI